MLKQDIVREATRLTRAGQLVEATVLLQRMLRGETEPDTISGTTDASLSRGGSRQTLTRRPIPSKGPTVRHHRRAIQPVTLERYSGRPEWMKNSKRALHRRRSGLFDSFRCRRI